MLGKLSLSEIPYDNPIIMGAVGLSIAVALAILGLITHHGKWGYLWREWLTSVDHKRIGVMYLVLALVMLLRGFADAILMRTQQALAEGAAAGYLPPEHFDQIFGAHGTIMIFFMAMPFLVGLWNLVVPQQIGARDLAFPFLNAASFWLTAAGALLVMVSLGVGDFSKAGWTGYPPLSELQYSPSTGVDYWIWAIQIAGLGSLMTGINFLATIVRMRAPGMTLMRMPVFVWTALVTCVLILLSFPVLTVALALLTLDRYLDMHFFTNVLGGNVMMYPNLFWIWGHPEVYILILPAFGVFSEVVPTFSAKRLFGYKSMVYATAAIGILSFTVWLHHFFTMGAGADVNAFFGIATMIIAVPTGVKVFNWLFTLYQGRVRMSAPLLWVLGFFAAFAIGGMTGVLLAVPPADFVLHNSLFLVAHFHNMLIPGALFAYLAGYMYWFPKAFGFALNEKWGKRAFWAWLVGFYMAFMPLYVLGFMGMPRRMEHYENPAWQPWLILAAAGAFVILVGIALLVVQLIVSIREREANRDLTGDPWDGRTLEWATASPPAVYNFAEIPVVDSLDAFWEMKRKGIAHPRPTRYRDIRLPKNTPAGFVSGALAFLFGFAMIWHMWWLAIASALGILTTVIARSFNDEPGYVLPAAEVERVERERFLRLAQATTYRPPDSRCRPAAAPAGARAMTTQAQALYAAEDRHEVLETQAFGFWLYILSDLILFSALFATFTVQMRSFAGGPTGRELFDLPYVFGETLLLLFSSATYGLAMLAMREKRRERVLRWLGITFFLGLGFILMEILEFHGLVLEGYGPDRSGFLSAYFTLVGTHGTHVTFGLVWMAVLIAQVGIKGLAWPVQGRLLRLSVFWHFLDIVWIGVFSVVYLLGAML